MSKRVGEMARGDVEDAGAYWRNSEVSCSTIRQERYNEWICWCFEDEKDLNDNSDGQDNSELDAYGLETSERRCTAT